MQVAERPHRGEEPRSTVVARLAELSAPFLHNGLRSAGRFARRKRLVAGRSYRRAVTANGYFPTEQTAPKTLYLVT